MTDDKELAAAQRHVIVSSHGISRSMSNMPGNGIQVYLPQKWLPHRLVSYSDLRNHAR
jgi:hypothetical protein